MFWDCVYSAHRKDLLLLIFVVDINCEVTAGHKYVHFSPSGIAPGGCFPRARPQPPRENHSAGSSDTCYSRRSHHPQDRKSTRLNSRHVAISYAVFCLKKKKTR